MHNPYRGGTPDKWYSGLRGDLWVEWKWLPKFPRNGWVVPDLSPLQMKWLAGRYREGRHVAVIVGAPEGCAIAMRPAEWAAGMPCAAPFVCTKQETARWIAAKCT